LIQSILSRIYFGNSVYDYSASCAMLLIGFIVIFILKRTVLKKLKIYTSKTKSRIDDLIVLQTEKFGIPLLYFCVLYFSVISLRVPVYARKYINAALVIIATFFTVRFILLGINYSLKYFARNRESNEPVGIKGVSTFVSILIWGLALVFLLDNLGFKISAVVTGLGIGGIAVALAAQAVLGDLFSYFVIFFDRPFQTGDFISVDDKSGTIEKIGIKTTRIAGVGGEQIIFPNSNLTNSRIHNFKRMQHRRILFKINVAYQTPLNQLKEIPLIVKSIIDGLESAKFDRAHFLTFGDSSLVYEIVYFVNSPDFIVYADTQHLINLMICGEFEKRGITIAYPTRTIFMGNQEKGGHFKD